MPDASLFIIEPDFSGHRWRYVEWALQAYAEAGRHCVMVTDAANLGHPLAQALQSGRHPGCTLLALPLPPDAGRGAGRIAYVSYWRIFRHLYRQACAAHRAGLVLVPYADYFLWALPLLGSPFGATPWLGITMRAGFHHHRVGVRAPRQPLVNAVKTLLFRRALRTPGLKTLLSIDPTLPAWHGDRSGAALTYLADPSPDMTPATRAAGRARLGLTPDSGPVLLVYGAITARKGIRELVCALATHRAAPRLVVAGAQDDEIRAWLPAAAAGLSPPPLVLDRFIPEPEEADLFSACDAVWLGYQGHYGMSGVLVQAYRFGKPVLATADGLIGWFCGGRDLGPVMDDLSPVAIHRALDQLMQPPSPLPSPRPAGTGSHAHLLARHTVTEFKLTLRRAAA
ncbi:hypothetical protein Tamer19_31270 [Cupriavidus sp. TA19]|uniref:glycosyltransferase n=1 Tax=unclassified Cupriavidus TaxID=2640874 RepID=UPI0027294CED|nr:glycosyltransferase [Cupriavidus sp. TA19]GLC93719.1 hypothetical protein Tamer19_31270 [Cupriavidus sp. TA19]